MKLAQDKLKKIKPQQSKLAKKLDLTENEINLAKRDIISFLRKADRPAMTDPKKFFKAFVDYTTGKKDQPGGFAKVIYDKLSLPKDGRLSTKNREAFIREIAEDLIALNKVDPAVMRRSKWKPFYELEIKNMSPKQTQKAIDEGKVKDHYQEFKNYIAFATGRKRTLKTAWTFVYRTVQFFLKGITQWKK